MQLPYIAVCTKHPVNITLMKMLNISDTLQEALINQFFGDMPTLTEASEIESEYQKLLNKLSAHNIKELMDIFQ